LGYDLQSRKDWLLVVFLKAGSNNSRNRTYQFWRQENHPIELPTDNFTNQKLEYIQNNPVEAGIVEKVEEICIQQCPGYYESKNVGLLNIECL